MLLLLLLLLLLLNRNLYQAPDGKNGLHIPVTSRNM